jgi:hypothetical protein
VAHRAMLRRRQAQAAMEGPSDHGPNP